MKPPFVFYSMMHCKTPRAIIGSWLFERRISERLQNTVYTVQGQLNITETSWEETGSMNGMPFYQHYRVCMEGGFALMFEDGREFYRLKDIHCQQRMWHVCVNDVYRGTWFLDKETLTLCWDVKGPNKDYISVTTYVKISEN